MTVEMGDQSTAEHSTQRARLAETDDWPNGQPYRLEFDSFQKWVKGERMPLRSVMVLGLKSIFSLLETFVRYVPGPIGYKLRYYYFKPLLKHLGKNVLIDVGVTLIGARNISIGDYTWIDGYTRLEAMVGEISIGKRCHVGAFVIMGAREPIVLGDYVGIGASSKIYSNSELPEAGRRMCGPMIPQEFKASKSLPITLEKDSFIGANTVLLPGAELGEGAVVGANSLVTRKIEPYAIVVGPTARVVGERERVTVPES